MIEKGIHNLCNYKDVSYSNFSSIYSSVES